MAFSCPQCGQQFERGMQLAQHMMDMHQRILASDLTNSEEIPPPKQDYMCQVCGQVFEEKKKLYVHRSLKHPPPRLDLSCSECKASYDLADSLQQHLKGKHGIRCYLCVYCGESFNRINKCSQHILDVHPDKMNGGEVDRKEAIQFSCLECSAVFDQAQSVEQHMRAKHNIAPFFCPDCGLNFKKRKQLLNHVEQIHPNADQERDVPPRKYDLELLCLECGFMYEGTQLQQHLREEHGIRTFICEYCGVEHEKLFQHKQHVAVKHTDKERLFNTTKPKQEDVNKNKAVKDVKVVKDSSAKGNLQEKKTCKECGQIFSDVEELQGHLQHLHNLKCYFCKYCEMWFDKLSLCLQHGRETHPDQFESYSKQDRRDQGLQTSHSLYSTKLCLRCSECKVKFTEVLELHQHLKSCHNIVKFFCFHCGIDFDTSAECIKHMKASHPNAKPTHQCSLCQEMFESHIILENHLQLNHGPLGEALPDGSTYKCLYCDATFLQGYALKQHTADDHGEATFPCHYCNAVCRSSKGHYNHTKEKHGVVPKELFPCRHCADQFDRQHNLINHVVQKHELKVYSCLYCDAIFDQEHAYIYHTDTHRPSSVRFRCQECSAVFGQEQSLYQHFRLKHQSLKYQSSVVNTTSDLNKFEKKKEVMKTPDNLYWSAQSAPTNSSRGSKEIMPMTGLSNIPRNSQVTSSTSVNALPVDLPPRPTAATTSGSATSAHQDKVNRKGTTEVEKQFNCPHCLAFFKSGPELNLHMFVDHTAQTAHSCTYCKASFTSELAMLQHVSMKHAVPGAAIFCFRCGQIFQQKEQLKQHITEEHTTYESDREAILADNVDGVHQTLTSASRASPLQQPSAVLLDEGISNTAKYSLLSTRLTGRMPNVIIGSSALNTSASDGKLCPQLPFASTIASGMTIVGDSVQENSRSSPAFICPLCCEEFVSLGILCEHVQQKHDLPPGLISSMCGIVLPGPTSPVYCSQCMQKVMTKEQLRDHVTKIHGPFFVCTCGSYFLSPLELSLHKEIVHPSDHPEESKHMGNAASQDKLNLDKVTEVNQSTVSMQSEKSNLPKDVIPKKQGHVSGKKNAASNDIQNVKPPVSAATSTTKNGGLFSCEYCAKQYKYHHSLLQHVETAHPDKVDAGPATCDFCQVTFKNQRGLAQHMSDTKHQEKAKLEDTKKLHEKTPPGKDSSKVKGAVAPVEKKAFEKKEAKDNLQKKDSKKRSSSYSEACQKKDCTEAQHTEAEALSSQKKEKLSQSKSTAGSDPLKAKGDKGGEVMKTTLPNTNLGNGEKKKRTRSRKTKNKPVASGTKTVAQKDSSLQLLQSGSQSMTELSTAYNQLKLSFLQEQKAHHLFPCDVCGAECYGQLGRETHMKLEHGTKYNVDSTQPSDKPAKNELIEDMSSGSIPASQPTTLQAAVVLPLKHSSKTIACTVENCGWVFTSIPEAAAHLETEHAFYNSEVKYACPYSHCTKKCKGGGGIHMHIYRMHQGMTTAQDQAKKDEFNCSSSQQQQLENMYTPLEDSTQLQGSGNTGDHQVQANGDHAGKEETSAIKEFELLVRDEICLHLMGSLSELVKDPSVNHEVWCVISDHGVLLPSVRAAV